MPYSIRLLRRNATHLQDLFSALGKSPGRTPRLGRDFPEEIKVFLSNVRRAKIAGPLLSIFGESLPQALISKHAEEGITESFCIPGWDEQPVLFVGDDLAGAVWTICRYDRSAAGHGLHNDVAKPFPKRRQHEYIRRRHELEWVISKTKK